MSDLQLSPRRNADPRATPGRCANLDYCSIGMQRVLVQIPVGQPFICPECGRGLRPPGEVTGGRSGLLPILRLAVFAGGVVLALAIGYSLGRVQPAVQIAVSAASQAATVQLNTARAALGLRPADMPQPGATAIDPPPPKPPPYPKPAPPQLVIGRPFPSRLAPVDVASPPPHLLRETRFGQVTIDCLLPAGQTKPTCRVADIRGGNTFSPAARAWLEGLGVQYLPDHGQTPLGMPDHRWRVVLEDFSGNPKAAPAR